MFAGTLDGEPGLFLVGRTLTPSHPTGQSQRTGVFYPIRGLDRDRGGEISSPGDGRPTTHFGFPLNDGHGGTLLLGVQRKR